MPTPDPCLTGVRVLDLTRLLPGPYASWLLRSMGAEVLRVESPGLGDYARMMPPMLGPNSAMFHVINRGKRSITLDLKQPEGQAILLRLAAQSDVVFEQFRPGVMDRLGVGYEALKAVNERVILCSLSGYGQTGPLAGDAGHDMNYQALTGVLHLQGTRGGPPALSTPPMADLVGAQTAVSSIVGALFRRDRTGQGAWLDVSMSDAVAGFAAPFLASWNAAALDPEDAPPERGEALLGGGLAQYSVYETKDGRHLAVGALEPKFFATFAALCGHPEWSRIPPIPGPDQAALREAVAAVVHGRTRAEWEAALAGTDCCVTPVLTPREAMETEQLRARGGRAEYWSAQGVVRWAETPVGPAIPGGPPDPGQHTDEVLAALGLSPAEVADLRARGVVE